MADIPSSKSGGGCLRKLIVLFLLVVAGAFGAAVYFVVQPEDLTEVGGYDASTKILPARDMTVVLKNAIDRGYPVSLSETEINQWLGRVLATKQGGPLASQISLDRLWVRFEDGRAELIMVRRIMGRTFTTSMYVRIEQLQGPKGVVTEVHLDGGPYQESMPKPLRGGRFGQLVVPQGFLILVKPAYDKLVTLFPEEIRLGFEEMARIKIEKGRIVLDPREPSNSAESMPLTF